MSTGTPTCRAEDRIEKLGVARGEATGVDEGGRRQIFQAARLTTAAPHLEIRFAHRERQQLIAHRLGGTVALVNQPGGPPPIERSILPERHVDRRRPRR